MAENVNITVPWDVRRCIVVPDYTAPLPVKRVFLTKTWYRNQKKHMSVCTIL